MVEFLEVVPEIDYFIRIMIHPLNLFINKNDKVNKISMKFFKLPPLLLFKGPVVL